MEGDCMKKILKNITVIVILLVITTGFVYAGNNATDKSGLKKYTIFLGRPMEDYPVDGTILGDWIEKESGVKLDFEFPVGDLKQKVGLIIAGGDYPDMMDGRNENRSFLDAGAFIPLNDLIEEYGVNAKILYGDRLKMLEQEDGNIYWFPQLFPYGDKVQATTEAHGLYIQKAVLKEFGWPWPKNLEEAVDMLIEYAKKYPEINGNKTYAYTALAWGWREFPLMNAPHILSGHPNDGSASVDWVDGKWVATQFYDTKEAYKIYKIYNKIYLAGLYDTESFVMDYDQYLAKLSTGSILAFYDQRWQFEKVEKLLRDQGEDRFYVGMPIVMDGYTEEFEGPLSPQVSEGVGITVDCKDPVGAFKYLDFLLSEKVQITKQWGFLHEDYEIDDNGYFYRTPEQIEKWDDSKWRDYTFGQKYWIEMCGWDHKSMYSDGKNAVNANNQPSVYYAKLKETEKEVLDAYGKKTWFDFFHKPDMRRASYFPMWTIKIPTGSDIHIANEKILEVRRKYTPRLIMAEEGEYDKIWKAYTDELNKIPNKKKHEEFYQIQMEKRIKKAGF
jgi:putative aldouronate transport system substrate-binding protein